MLIFEPESFCIPAEESEVESIYRSSSPVFIGDDKSLPSCEAFVCIIHREQRHHVFAALHLGEIKRNLIFVVAPIAGELPVKDLPLGKALSFVEAMGFSMEPVNLKYGKAMREVVLRSIPVLLSPGNMERIRGEIEDELSELNSMIAEAAEDPEGLPEEDDPEKQGEKKRTREARKSAANAAARKLDLEKCAAEKAAAVEKSVQKFLLNVNASEMAQAERAEYERMLGEKAALEKRVAEMAKTVRRLEKDAEIDRSEAKRRIAELEADVDKNLKEIEAARSARKEAILEKEAGEERIADLEMALHNAGEELEEKETLQKEWAVTQKAFEVQILELERALAEARSKDESPSLSAATLQNSEERIVQLEQEIGDLREAAEAAQFERELLVREKASALKRIEKLEKEKAGDAGVEEDPGEYRSSEKEKRLAETENAEQARCELEAERKERERLEAECVLFEKRILKMEGELRKAAEKGGEARRQQLSETNAPTAELVSSLQKALQRAEERTEILRQEIERLAAAKASAEKRLAEKEQGSRKEAPPPRGETPAPSAGAKFIPPPPTVRRPPPKGAFFHVDWDLGSVEYDSPEDILEVQQSMNMAQLSLEGYHGQNCSAWIIALKKGKSRQVYVVFGLSESAINLVYSPAKPIRNHDDYKRALSEAVKFLEVVGYLPEKVPLGGSPREQGRALKSIPVLQGPRKKVQGGSPMISTGSV